MLFTTHHPNAPSVQGSLLHVCTCNPSLGAKSGSWSPPSGRCGMGVSVGSSVGLDRDELRCFFDGFVAVRVTWSRRRWRDRSILIVNFSSSRSCDNQQFIGSTPLPSPTLPSLDIWVRTHTITAGEPYLAVCAIATKEKPLFSTNAYTHKRWPCRRRREVESARTMQSVR